MNTNMGRIVDISVDPLALQVFNHKTGRQAKNVEPANHSVAVKETRHQRFVPMQRKKKIGSKDLRGAGLARYNCHR